MQLHVTREWLTRTGADDRDMEVEAGHPIESVNGCVSTPVDNRSASDLSVSLFGYFVRQFRKRRGLTVPELAARLQVAEDELRLIERNSSHQPDMSVVRHIATAVGVSEHTLVMLTGANENASSDVYFRKAAFAFVDRSEDAAELTSEEQKAFDNYLVYLKERPALASEG